MAVREAPSPARQWTVALTVAALALGLSAALRFRVVEPAQVSAFCGAVGSADPLCALRALVVTMFSQQRLGWLALALALLALWTRRRAIGLSALATACAGLMLYCARPAAPAAVLATLALLPAWRVSGQSDGGDDDQAADSASESAPDLAAYEYQPVIVVPTGPVEPSNGAPR